ncbi:LOW QUALITY PROTEIN: hypothetical protein Q4I32_002950 [Leishmania shawi]|uniref:Uncharacterized protein n=1 Tax=Leishmania shawi TaxID=5680 RepID=A0AAW3C0V7_9TRYP
MRHCVDVGLEFLRCARHVYSVGRGVTLPSPLHCCLVSFHMSVDVGRLVLA